MTNLLDLIGDKWSLIVIRDLFLYKNTFSQMINEGDEKISTNILSDRLKKLLENGFIGFINDKNDHKVKHYYPTDKGLDLNAVIYEMTIWRNRNLDRDFNEVSTHFFEMTKNVSIDLIISNNKDVYKKTKKYWIIT